MRTLVSVALLLGVSNFAHAGSTYYVDLVNTAQNSIVSFAVALPGSGNFREAALGNTPLHGGGDSTTIAIRNNDGGGCLRDLRTAFADGRTLIQKNFNVCKYRSYHTGQYLHGHAQTVIASVP